LKINQVIDHKSYGIKDYAYGIQNEQLCDSSVVDYSALKQIQSGEINIVHFSNATRKTLIAFLFSKKTITVIHDVQPRAVVLRFVYPLIHHLIKFFSNAVIVHSNYAADVLRNKYKYPEYLINIIPHYIKKIPKLRPVVLPGRNDRCKVIAFVGSISKRRGQLDFYRRVISNRKNYMFYIIGKSSQDLSIFGDMQNVHIFDYPDENNLLNLLVSSDCICVYRDHSAGESSGMIALAKSVGKPVLCSNVGAFPEQVLDSGVTFPNEISVNDFYDQVNRVIESQLNNALDHEVNTYPRCIKKVFGDN